MEVLIIVRPTLFTVKGGDTIQVIETAKQLNKLGVKVDIKPAHEKINYSSYHLLHFFNIIRPADILIHIKKSNKPFVVSSIFIDYSLYDKVHRGRLAGKLFKLMTPDGIEYVKNVYRYVSRKDKLASVSYLWKGQRRSISAILQKVKCLLVHSEEEYNQLIKMYKSPASFAIVQNGIDTDLFKPDVSIQREDNLVLCVARIEGIKNQYNLIKALNNTKYKLLLIGDAAPNQQAYYRQCKKLAAANVSFIKYLPQQELIQYYTKAKVHVLPSLFEVCGLSSLEAAAMGCNIVITANGYAKEYFKEAAYYCNPADADSILAAVDKAAGSSTNKELQKNVIENFTWKIAAGKILAVYKKSLV